MDRVYKEDIPRFIAALEAVGESVRSLNLSADWKAMRVRPLLAHARRLQQIATSPKFLKERSRLPGGVKMFRSDLVYLRTNVLALEDICRAQAARGARGTRSGKQNSRAGNARH